MGSVNSAGAGAQGNKERKLGLLYHFPYGKMTKGLRKSKSDPNTEKK